MEVPRWVVRSWHMSAVITTAFLILLAALAFENLRASNRAVVELRHLNLFFDSTLARAQRRADSARAETRRELDSLKREGNR